MPHQDAAIATAFMGLLAGLAAPCYAVGPAIASQKRDSAKRLYRIDPDDEVLALIDTSLIGASAMASAKFGMAIGWFGLYWRNPFYEQSPRSQLTWAELGARAGRMRAERHGLIALGDDARFVSAASLDDAQLIDLLRRCVEFWRGKPLADRAALRGGVPAQAALAVAARPAQQAEAYASAGHRAQLLTGGAPGATAGARHDMMSQIVAQPYLAALTAMLALWLHARDGYSFDELDAIVDYLRHDDSLPDSSQAIDRLIDRMRELNECKLKNPLKLPALRQRCLADIAGFDGETLKLGLRGLLDGVAAMAQDRRTPSSDAAYVDIRRALQGEAGTTTARR